MPSRNFIPICVLLLDFTLDRIQISSASPWNPFGFKHSNKSSSSSKEGSSSSASNTPTTVKGNDESAQNSQIFIQIEKVTDPSSAFLSNVEELPILIVENMTFRLDYAEPSDDDRIMNDARADIGETDTKLVETAKKELIELLKKNTNLRVPWTNNAWLIRFLRVKRYNVELTNTLIEEYYNFKRKNSNLLNDLVPSESAHVFEKAILVVWPFRDELKRRLLIMRTKKWDPKKCSLVELFQQVVLITEAASYEPTTQLAGVQVIIDLEGLGRKHFLQFKNTYQIVRAMIDHLQNALPVRLKGLHILNHSFFFELIFQLFKGSISDVMYQRIHFHNSVPDLHEYVSKSYLPDIYGGTFTIPNILSEQWHEILRYGDQEFAEIMSYGY